MQNDGSYIDALLSESQRKYYMMLKSIATKRPDKSVKRPPVSVTCVIVMRKPWFYMVYPRPYLWELIVRAMRSKADDRRSRKSRQFLVSEHRILVLISQIS